MEMESFSFYFRSAENLLEWKSTLRQTVPLWLIFDLCFFNGCGACLMGVGHELVILGKANSSRSVSSKLICLSIS